MKSIVVYRIATAAVPILSLGIASVAISVQARRLYSLKGDVAITRTKVVQVTHRIEEIEAQPPITVHPTVPLTAREQPDFLKAIQAMAALCKVQITHWTNGTGALATDAPNPKKIPLPPAVVAVTSQLEVTGRYSDIRRFLYAVEGSQRLLTTSNMVWTRTDKWPQTILNFTVVRYLGPPIPGAPSIPEAAPDLVTHSGLPPVASAAPVGSETLHMPPTKVYLAPGLRHNQNSGGIR